LTLNIADDVIVSPWRRVSRLATRHRIHRETELPEGGPFVNKTELIEHIAKQADISKARRRAP
jgi:hypothetical protein